MRSVARLGWTLGVGLLALGVVGTPASGAVNAKPRPGHYTGQAHYSSGPVSVTFRVNRKRTKVVDFGSEALVKPGCTAPNSSFQTPLNPEKISKSGRFKQSYGAYDDPSGKPYHVTVTVTGHFTSRTKAVGTFILVSKKYKHCSQSASWSATRTG
jgi:hypothetical protein